MKTRIKTIMGAMVVALIATSCTDYLKEGTVDLTIPGEQPEDKVYTLNHPCALFTQADFDRVKDKVAAKEASDPVYVSWQNFQQNSYCQKAYTANPQPVIVRGNTTGTGVSEENYIIADRDAAAALQLAMRWRISGDETFATAAVNVLNDWARVCQKITANDANQFLLAGFQGYQFANAAELLRDYEGWTANDKETFKKWLLDVWASKNLDFLTRHCNTVPLHYWTNWDLANMASYLSIGIFTDNQEMINYVVNYFKFGIGGGAINNMIPYEPVADPDGKTVSIAQCMESGRDQGHATLVTSICAELCEMAYNIGEDLFAYDNYKVLRMFEYTAKFNVAPRSTGTFLCTPNQMPFTPYVYSKDSNPKNDVTHTGVSEDGRGTIRPCWDLIYNHYSKVVGLSSNNYYYTALFADQLRYTNGVLSGDGGAGDARYGNNSSAFDQVGWGTMMFTR